MAGPTRLELATSCVTGSWPQYGNIGRGRRPPAPKADAPKQRGFDKGGTFLANSGSSTDSPAYPQGWSCQPSWLDHLPYKQAIPD